MLGLGLSKGVLGQTNVSTGLDFDNQDPAMNEKYEKGSHLVYDCDGYYVCTKKEEYEYCKTRRSEAIEGLKVDLYCAPIEVFPSEKDCHARQLELTSEGKDILFCTHAKEKFLR